MELCYQELEQGGDRDLLRHMEPALREGLLPSEAGESGNEAREQPGNSPYRYTEAFTDSAGMYHPQRLAGIRAEEMGDPQLRRLAGYLKEWSPQESRMSCAVSCQREIINTMSDRKTTESELRRLGAENGWYSDTEGTRNADRGKLAEQFGLSVRQYYGAATSKDLAELKNKGVGLIVSVDHQILARPELPKQCKTDHSVLVLDYDFSDAENPKVILNDPGRSDGCGAVYPLELFERAAGADAHGRLHAVTSIYQKEGVRI